MRNQKGFTLIEIALVVFILGSLFLIAAPKLLEQTNINLKSASRTLTGTIKYLYNEAVFKKNIYRLTFDIDRGEYWPEVLEGNQFLKRDDIVFRTKKLPDGVFFADIQTQRTRGKIDSGSDVFIIFLPTGFVDPAVIHLRTGNEKFFTLSTNPYTGITKVFDQYIEFVN